MAQNSILLIDPLKDILNAYRAVLEKEDYLVETAKNFDEAFHRLLARQYSVIITEYLHPFEDLHRMIGLVKQEHPETYVILLSLEIIDEIKYEKLFDVGVDDLILKPFPPEKVLVHIKKGLRQGELILKKRQLEKQALLDPIAQEDQNFIFNDVYFKKCFQQEIKKATRHKRPLSLVLVEIPYLEEMGEQLNNFCKELGQIVRKYTREEDLVGRHNGAFGVILPETDQGGSKAFVSRLLNLIQNYPGFQSDETIKPFLQTLSLKTFTYPDNFTIPESLA